MSFTVEVDPRPTDVDVLEAGIGREAAAATGLGDREELAIFVREAGEIVAGISGWTWGDSCELEHLWVAPSHRDRWLGPRLLDAAERAAAARACTQVVILTYGFQAGALYGWFGYDLLARVDDFPSGTDVRLYRKRLPAV